ncbi:MAG: hypothetical protein ACI4PE_03810 [Bacilli bacterium]
MNKLNSILHNIIRDESKKQFTGNLKIQCEESILNDIETLEIELFNQPISKRLAK